MKIYRYLTEGKTSFAIDRGRGICRVEADSVFEAARTKPGEDGKPVTGAVPAAPLIPGKIVAVGRNYADHAKELGNAPPAEPLLFLKPPSTVVGPDQPIVIPSASSRVDFEGELAIVIGRQARRVPARAWRDFVLGFTCANDVTARDLQKKDVQFTRGKSFDTFCPLGPCIVTDLDPSDLALKTRLNGETRQDARTSQMIFDPAVLMEFITAIMTLFPGDIILTGTPAGVAPMSAGDTVEIEIEGIGILRNPLAAESRL